MSTRRAAVAVLAVTAVAGVGVAAGVFLTRGEPSDAGPSAAPSATTSVEAAVPAGDALPQPTEPAPVSAEPGDGQAVATDEPVVVTGSEVSVVVTAVGWDPSARAAIVRGYAGSVIEDGATCRLTLTKDGVQVSAERAATPDASNTSCGRLSVSDDRLTPGTWTAVLSYTSAEHFGTADRVDVEVTS